MTGELQFLTLVYTMMYIRQNIMTTHLSLKIVLILLCGALMTNAASSQTWRELLDRSHKLFNEQYASRNLDSAIYYGRRALDTATTEFGKADTNVAIILSYLGECYFWNTEYSASESFYRQSLAIWEQTAGLHHPSAMQTLNYLANSLDDIGRHREAIELTKKLLTLRREKFGPDHIDIGRSYGNLAIIFIESGRYAEAVPLLNTALKIFARSTPVNQMAQAVSMSTLGVVFENQHRLIEAESLDNQARKLFTALLGEQTMQVGMCINNLGHCLQAEGRLSEAKEKYAEAIGIWERADPKSSWMPIAMGQLAGIECAEGHLVKAESLYQKTIKLHEATLGHDHPWVAEDVEGLANVFRGEGRYVQAMELYRNAIEIDRKKLFPLHDDFASGYDDMGKCLRMSGDLTGAIVYAESSFYVRQENFRTISAGMAESDALEYEASLRESRDHWISYLQDAGELQRSASLILTTKGALTDDIIRRNRLAAAESDTTIRNLLQAHHDVLADLSKYVVRHGDEEPTLASGRAIDSLKKSLHNLEIDMAQRNASTVIESPGGMQEPDSIAGMLPPSTMLIEYLRYNYLPRDSKSTVPHYLVFVLDRSGVRLIKNLGNADVIDSAVLQYRANIFRQSGAEKNSPGEHEESTLARALYTLLIKPIGSVVAKARTLFIAPDGDLNLLSFASLMDEEGTYVIEKHPIHYLSAGRDVIRLRDRLRSAVGVIAFGDPDFNASIDERLGKNSHVTLSLARAPADPYELRNVRSGCEVFRHLDMMPLPGTREEVLGINEAWQRQWETTAIYLGSDASEEHFKSDAPGHRVIHLATHGYFLHGDCLLRSKDKSAIHESGFIGENPLLQSGLFFAGANLHGVGADSVGAEDGILTALEVSAMNLRGTDLVVLSACETGLGKVEQGEGVYGLRRAFQMAGAKTVVSSLWQVSDDETMRFMKQLYAQSASTYPELIQKVMLNRLRELRLRHLPTHPYSWAGFVATGDWRINYR